MGVESDHDSGSGETPPKSRRMLRRASALTLIAAETEFESLKTRADRRQTTIKKLMFVPNDFMMLNDVLVLISLLAV